MAQAKHIYRPVNSSRDFYMNSFNTSSAKSHHLDFPVEVSAFLSNAQLRLTFPKLDRIPTASIVILTHNHVDLLYHCLISVLVNTPLDYEAIIADNASTDDTTLFLSRVDCVRVVRSKSNIEFLRANNLGARFAQDGIYFFLITIP